jgi:hypothetical protein
LEAKSVLTISTKFADYFNPTGGVDVPRDLIGAKIIAIGAPLNNENIESVGLIIDYKPLGESFCKRLVLGFNECGMWINYCQTLRK